MKIRVVILLALLASGCWLRSKPRVPFSFAVEETLPVSAPDRVSAAGPNGPPIEYVADQLVIRPVSRGALDDFLAKYRGRILVDGATPRTADGITTPATGWYLIEIDPATSSLDDLAEHAQGLVDGRVTFSSERAARLAAVVARERATVEVGVNLVLRPQSYQRLASVLEHPQGTGFLDFKTRPYMQLARVIDAWDYLAYHGIPFGPRPWRRPTIAIVDGGFALRDHLPIGGNSDFDITRIAELNNTVSYSDPRRHDAGGTNPAGCGPDNPCPWHGTETYSVAAAVPNNRFGGAGVAGNLPRVILVKSEADIFHVADAIADAGRMKADVINLSLGQVSGEVGNWIAGHTFKNVETNITFARGYALATIVVSAGNDTESNEPEWFNVPCTLDGVLCVGETDHAGASVPSSGRGSRVDLWAPGCIDVTPTPSAAGVLGTSTGVFCGTSAAAPFVSGVIALLKALEPNLHPDDVQALLRTTARKVSDPVVDPGVVDALAAAQALRPNLPPTVAITSHSAGQVVARNVTQNLIATIADPELEPNDVTGMTVVWRSDREGQLCVTNNCQATLTELGAHQLTATVTDGWGGVGTQTIAITVGAGAPPRAAITAPANGATFAASQQIELRGVASGTGEAVIPDARLVWTSNLAGALGTGRRRLVALPPGTHVITLRATDVSGQVGAASITVDVAAATDVPTARILTPLDGDNVPVNAPFILIGRGTDPIQGDLPDSALTWRRADGTVLGTGRTLSVALPGPPCGPLTDRIFLRVRNAAGRESETSIEISIGPVC